MQSKTSSTVCEGDHRPGLQTPPLVSIEEACQLHERAVALREQGQHAEAARCARHALAAFERECGPDHPDVANILNNLAGICEDQGDSLVAALYPDSRSPGSNQCRRVPPGRKRP
jgi:Tetratricopeptide repeat